MSEKMTTKQLCLNGLFIAIVCLCTMIIRIPVPATNGYIHIGDSVIIIISVFFGKKYGAAAGGIGSALADLFSGYPHWMLFTFVIKGIMGFVIGSLADRSKSGVLSFKNVFAPVIGIIWMIIGYVLGGTVLEGSFLVALSSVPSNIIQGIGGFVIYIVMGCALEKSNFFKIMN